MSAICRMCGLIGLLGLAGVISSGCVPTFSELQGAELVGEEVLELTPSASLVTFANGGESDHVQDHLGLQAAYGWSDHLDLRVRYERIVVVAGDGDFTANVVAFGPKFGEQRGRAALYLPVGCAFGDDVDDSSETWQFHPTLLFTIPMSRNLELNPSTKALIPLTQKEGDTLLALNLGLAFKGDSGGWAIRPEFGILIDPGEDGYYLHFSLGLSLRH